MKRAHQTGRNWKMRRGTSGNMVRPFSDRKPWNMTEERWGPLGTT